MKYIKYIGIFIIVLLMGMTMVTMKADATPPRFIGLNYNTDTNTLKVLVSHLSPVRSIHYIYRVSVEKNGVLEQSHFYTKQPSFFLNRYEYNIAANPGDTLTVSAFCILWGYNTRSIIVQ